MKTVMIVDDAAFLRKQLRHLLEALKYEVFVEATNGEEAIRLNELYKPDIIFMDITMPVMDGMTASEIILKNYPGTHIIMCSALGYKGIIMKLHTMGITDFVVKPFHSDRVKQALDKLEITAQNLT